MLTSIQSASVAPEVNLRNSLHAGDKARKRATWNPGETLPEVRNRSITGPTKMTYFLQIFFHKKGPLSLLNSLLRLCVNICISLYLSFFPGAKGIFRRKRTWWDFYNSFVEDKFPEIMTVVLWNYCFTLEPKTLTWPQEVFRDQIMTFLLLVWFDTFDEAIVKLVWRPLRNSQEQC